MLPQPDRDPRLDRLWDLLPAVHRRRDAEQRSELRALLEIIAEQAALIEDDIAQRYDDAFIETCADWAIYYIGELVGVALPGSAAAPSRGTVANAVRNRRRKGSLAVLAQLARDAGEWPALAVEFGRLLGQTQSLRLGQPMRGRAVDVRDATLERGAFDRRARGMDLRRPGDVGVYLWRLRSYPVTRAPAACIEDIGPHLYTFSVLANDVPLFNTPLHGVVASPLDAPVQLDRALFSADRARGRVMTTAKPSLYGDGRAVSIWASGWPTAKADGKQPIPPERIIVADLDDWRYIPPKDHVAVDPVRGRIAFPPRQFPRRSGSVTVSYHYGFSADIGGGEYPRPLAQDATAKFSSVRGGEALRKALTPWEGVLDDDGTLAAPADQPVHAIIELADSGVYTLPIGIMLAPGNSLQLRAAQRTRPTIRLIDTRADAPDSMTIEGGEGSRLILDGIMVAGRGVEIRGAIASVTLRHATLVPGWSLDADCDPRRPAEPSIEVADSNVCLIIERSIVGSIQINNDEVRTDPMQVRVSDSILDATGVDCDGPQCEALGAAGSRLAFATAQFTRSTIIGRVLTHAIKTAENSIFLGRVIVARRQIGHLRFCYVAPGARTPRQFRCTGVRPRFDSLRYGQPAYCRLAVDCAVEIAGGADDGNELGVFHHLATTRRLAGLAAALDDHVPVGSMPVTIFAD